MTAGSELPGSADRPDDERARFGIGTAVVLAVGGVILGLFGGFLQAWTVSVLGFGFPVGLLLVLATLLACIRALIHAFTLRRAGVTFFLGWVVATVVLALPSGEGDIVIARSGWSMAYLFGGVVLGSAAANLPARLRPPAPVTLVPSGPAVAPDQQ